MRSSPDTTAGPPGSLTEWLRARSDAQLADLLRRRPDLALPAPADLAQLASRLSVRTSVQRAVDGLDAFTLSVLEALVLAQPAAHGVVDVDVAGALLGAGNGAIDGAAIASAVDNLEALGLIWGNGADDRAVHLVATVADAVGPYPAGLGRPARTPALTDADSLGALLAACDADELEVLRRLAAGPPLGTVRVAEAREAGDEAREDTAPQRLLRRGLLVAVDAKTVELPREVAWALRDAPLGIVEPQPPQMRVVARSPGELDGVGTTGVFEALRLVAALAESWAAHPPALLRAGGIGVRDLRRTARDLGVGDATAALLIEVSAAAGLVGATTGIDPVYLPTVDFDAWLARPAAGRWAELAIAWLGMTRQPSLVGQRGDRDRVITALGPDVERGTLPALRATVLDALRTLSPGAAPAGPEDVLAWLRWQAPRRATGQRPLAAAVLVEADVLGITAAGGLTGYSRTLLAGSRAAAEQALASALPEPVDHVLVQPDLSVVVPGPPAADIAATLALLADLESAGGASVFRITEATIRRALDAGRTAAEISAFLAQRSRTPIPQALSYLIDDVARRHGVLRAGAASAYLRSDDDALLARLLADRNADALGLRRIAPTIVISSAPVTRVLDVLRGAGYAPAAESPDGAVITLGTEAARAPSRAGVRVIRPRSAVDDSQLADLVRRVRAGDTLTELSRHVAPVVQQVPGVTSATTMALLRQAIREGRTVLLGSADPDGTTSRRTILPISLAGGFVRGHEPATQRLQSFPLHRLTSVSIIADDTDTD